MSATLQLTLADLTYEPRIVVEFWADGFPKPKGNLAIVTFNIPGRGPFSKLREATKGIDAWLRTVRGSARAAMGDTPPSSAPIRLDAWFRFIRPLSHTLPSGKLSATGRRLPRPRGGSLGGRIGDIDKLIRAVCDALQQTKKQTPIAFVNDDQVAELHVYREWGDREGVRVRVQEIAT